VDPEHAQVEVDGVLLPVRPGLVYYVLYKPPGVVSTVNDPQGRTTVVQLVPSEPRVHPVGRLDESTEGLLILTNDGDLTHRLTHPRYGVEKTYVALVAGDPAPATVRALVAGVELEDGPAVAARARVIDRLDDAALVEVVMREGRKREVRRMLEAVSHPVQRLTRTAIGPLRDAQLAPGSWRPLDVTEVRALYEAAGSAWQDDPDPAPPATYRPAP
jgi:23S rRNA pseudouridine2605 synthase